MSRNAFLIVCLCALGACTVVKINPGNTTTIEHKPGESVGKNLATRACRKAGERNAIIISTINKDASLPDGTGRQVTTFRCSSTEE